MGIMICPKCGSECDENQMFCTKCGTKINTFVEGFSNSENKEEINQSFDDIIGGLSLEEDDDEDMNRYLKRDLNANKNNGTEHIEKELVQDELLEEEPIPKKKQKPVYESNVKPSNYKKGGKAKKGLGRKKVILIIFAAILAVVIAVFATLEIKKASMTKKFDRYYAQGSQYYGAGNYKDAKTQYINASNNAFTKEQKIKAYEMVYKIDAIIGGYAEEEISYLESLISLDDSNIEYYKALIVLYQNNEQESKIEPLIASAPASLQSELQSFDGTIPVASQNEGTYDKPIEIELSAMENVTIYYTTDGSSVSDSTTKKEYTSPIKLEEEGTYTIRALSVDKNGKSSKEMTVKYILDFGTVNPPSVNLSSGKYTDKKKIQVTADNNCTIYYTTDGTMPTTKSRKYKKPITMPKGDSLYYFIAVNADGVESAVVTRAYDYVPEYSYSYDDAVSSLTSSLVSIKKLENKYGEFENGDVAYFAYSQITEIDEKSYYIITCEIEDKDGANKSTDYYAVSCDTGSCYTTVRNGDTYTLNELK
jgi:hypothetical protein